MPTVFAGGREISCDRGANLRQVLRSAGVSLHNGGAKVVNCQGIGSCGTCAVRVEGEVNPPNWRDRARRSLPPHDPQRPLRLACQTRVLGDVRVTKYDGFWGHGRRELWIPDTPNPPGQTL